jgi:arylformamidase
VTTYDISTPIGNQMAGFPGDPAVHLRKVRSIRRGDPYELSSISMGTHTGTHVDPPSHFIADGATVDRLDLAVLNGPCEVLAVPEGHAEVGTADLQTLPIHTERVLLKTSNSERWARSEEFFPDYVSLGAPAARSLVDRGVRLVGIDSLSVESSPDASFPVHRRLLGAGILILEGLRLGAVPPGGYELRCLPLRIHYGDGGPARAVLLGR